ncbi:MAG: hypothetical protein JWO95_2502, partial [Verrucomicrobiales bacterium]|nr:hypothetical protein [Verrucomicrobiales bacterium]
TVCLASICLVSRAADDGFRPLFNGKDFNGWYLVSGSKRLENDTNHLFTVHDGMVHMYKDAPDESNQKFGYMVTEKEYSNYILRFQYKWGKKKFGGKVGKKRDCGVLFHCIGPDGVWPKSVECQVQEGDTGDIFTVYTRVTTTVDPATTNLIFEVTTNETTHVVHTNSQAMPFFKEKGVPFVQGVSGSVRRVHHAKGDFEKSGWNTVEMIVHGSSAQYFINGKLDNGFTLLEHMVGDKWVPLTKGKILFQQEGAEVMYRNIDIKVLDENAS